MRDCYIKSDDSILRNCYDLEHNVFKNMAKIF